MKSHPSLKKIPPKKVPVDRVAKGRRRSTRRRFSAEAMSHTDTLSQFERPPENLALSTVR